MAGRGRRVRAGLVALLDGVGVRAGRLGLCGLDGGWPGRGWAGSGHGSGDRPAQGKDADAGRGEPGSEFHGGGSSPMALGACTFSLSAWCEMVVNPICELVTS